jgi:uncharacterized membrane protein YeaQ/YmgE (transglycosylase-associated protein family)
MAVALIIGLIGIAVGAHEVGPGHRTLDWHEFGLWALVFSVVGAFFGNVAGGWATGRIAGLLRAEPAMLHGAIVWLLTVPMFLLAAGLGVGSFFGWHGGLTGGAPAWYAAPAPTVESVGPLSKHATQEEQAAYEEGKQTGNFTKYEKFAATRAARNSALGAVTALLLGLVGSVLGGWMASGEPMHPFHYRTRDLAHRPAVPGMPVAATGPEATFHR